MYDEAMDPEEGVITSFNILQKRQEGTLKMESLKEKQYVTEFFMKIYPLT